MLFFWWGAVLAHQRHKEKKGVYPMNNAAMSGTHYPLDKEPSSLVVRSWKVKISNN